MIDVKRYILSFPTGYTQPVLRVDFRGYGAEAHGQAFVDERGLDDAYDRASKAAEIHREGIIMEQEAKDAAWARRRDLRLLGIDWKINTL